MMEAQGSALDLPLVVADTKEPTFSPEVPLGELYKTLAYIDDDETITRACRVFYKNSTDRIFEDVRTFAVSDLGSIADVEEDRRLFPPSFTRTAAYGAMLREPGRVEGAIIMRIRGSEKQLALGYWNLPGKKTLKRFIPAFVDATFEADDYLLQRLLERSYYAVPSYPASRYNGQPRRCQYEIVNLELGLKVRAEFTKGKTFNVTIYIDKLKPPKAQVVLEFGPPISSLTIDYNDYSDG